MPRKLDPAIAAVLKNFGFGGDACWDCHGVWVVYHRVLEQIAVKASIKFDPPMVLEADGQSKAVALCVTGHMNGDASQWSIGEASPHNYQVKGKQPAYPYAMAEKRAKDRVVLKLIGLHGLAYSEDEADDFVAPAEPAAPNALFLELREVLSSIVTDDGLAEWAGRVKRAHEAGTITPDERQSLIDLYKTRVLYIEQLKKAA